MNLVLKGEADSEPVKSYFNKSVLFFHRTIVNNALAHILYLSITVHVELAQSVSLVHSLLNMLFNKWTV